MLHLTRPEGSEPEDFAPSRRGAIAGLFFAGYALTAFSAEAETITTDSDGLVTAEVMIPQTDAPLPAYVARPAAAGRYAAVLVVSEVFGVHEYIRDVCRRLAKAGYVAIAPAFFHRAGDPASVTDFAEVQKIVETAGNDQVLGDVGAAVTWLKAQTFVDAKRLAVTGFCWGGAAVWMSAARFKDFNAGAAWYGRLTKPASGFLSKEDRPWPIDVAGQLNMPVIGLYGAKDAGIPAADIEAMRAAMKAKAKPGEIIVYPQGQHGFHADYRPSYDESSAKDGWVRMLAFFAAHGAAPGAA